VSVAGFKIRPGTDLHGPAGSVVIKATSDTVPEVLDDPVRGQTGALEHPRAAHRAGDALNCGIQGLVKH